jgi:mycothiol synthase
VTTHILPDGYTTRAPTLDDAQALADMIAACDMTDMGTSDTNVDEVLADWEGIDLDDEAVAVIAPDGSLVAYADLQNHGYVDIAVYGYVHPDHRGRGIGAWLVAWGEDWARGRAHLAPESARISAKHFVVDTNAGAKQLLSALGYAPIRTIYYMSIALDAPPPEPEWPAGIRVRRLVPGQDEQAAFAANREAFLDHWGTTQTTFDEWIETKQVELRDPRLCLLAVDEASGEIAGTCFCRVVAGAGWVSSIGVRRPWRRRGLGLALLRQTLAECWRQGVREVSLSADSESSTGAPRVYFNAGMHVARSYIAYQRELRPGEDTGRPPPDSP